MDTIESPPAEPTQRTSFTDRFNLHHDRASDEDIDRGIRAGVELHGATPWILMLAIVVASVGLNTNSTAVIIGAMLISPLMGPIVGLGYGIGILDFPLVRRSLTNLGIAAGISLLTSTLYFAITPLAEAQSELLARTTPSLWDVLIALAGGLAGIIGQTRREKSNVIPGVAIATALMPPLCTAGYGLANANWAVFGGAFYLFSINCVFIAFASVVVIEFLRLPHRKFVDPSKEKRVKRALLLIVLATGLPSIYLAAKLVDNEVFSAKARDFVRREFKAAHVHVVETRVAPRSREIEVTLIGPRLPNRVLQAIEARLADAGLAQSHLIVHQTESTQVDIGTLKADILADIVRTSQQSLQDQADAIASLRKQLAQQTEWPALAAAIAREFSAQFPRCGNVLVGNAVSGEKDAAIVPTLIAECRPALKRSDADRIAAWLRVRTNNEDARLLLSSGTSARGR